MDSTLDQLLKAFNQVVTPSLVFRRVMENRLSEAGLSLAYSVGDSLQQSYEQHQEGSFAFDVDDLLSGCSGSAVMGHEELVARLRGSISDDEINSVVAPFLEQASETLPGIIDTQASELITSLKASAGDVVESEAAERSVFLGHIDACWGEVLDHLEWFLVLCRDAGENSGLVEWSSHSPGVRSQVEVMQRLHARSCLISAEVIWLLRGGFPDGAMARWRSAHEGSVVALLIKEHGAGLAERYLQHEVIESYKAANQLAERRRDGEQEILTRSEMSALSERRAALLDRFGRSYGEQYGWASELLGNSRPTFAGLERAAGLDGLRPEYRLASHHVHANPKSVLFKLGLTDSHQHLALAGPSAVGFADPAFGISHALFLTTVALLNVNVTIDSVITVKVLEGAHRAVEHIITAALDAEIAGGEPLPDAP